MGAKRGNPFFVNFVKQKLKDRIGSGIQLDFVKNHNRNIESYVLMDYGGESATRQMKGTHDKIVPVVPIRDVFYMYVSIGYTLVGKKNQLNLSSVSFQIFDSERLIVRAEWNEENKNDLLHPQPHWHFHPYAKKDISSEKSSGNFQETLNDGFLKQLETVEYGEKVDVADMHFTMDYNIASNPYCIDWDESRVKDWAAKFIDSVFAELDFVISKGHKI